MQRIRFCLRAGLGWWLALAAAGGAGADPIEPPTVPLSAAADAATYARCMELAKADPAAAERLAQSWHQNGGAHPADHCAAVALVGLGQYRDAASHLETLAHAMVNAPTALRAEVYDQAGQAWLLAGDAVRAYAVAAEAASLAPGDPELAIDKAEAAAAAGNFDQAVAVLDRVLQRDPGRVDALIYRASAYRALGRLGPARADIDKALARRPNSAPALLERGNIRRLAGDLAGARRDWQRVGGIAPGSRADLAARANLADMTRAEPATPARPQ